MKDKNLVNEIAQAVEDIESEKAEELVNRAINQGVAPLKIINDAIVPGLKRVGERYDQGQYFLPELAMAGNLAKKLVGLVTTHLPKELIAEKKKVVIGTVKGDLHDIGKNLVSLMLSCTGYEVYDLGIDVPTMGFIKKVREVKADVLGLSSLLWTTLPNQAEVIQYLRELGLRDSVIVVIGGAPTSKEFAESIGADGWAPDAAKAVEEIDRLVAKRR